MLTKKFCTRQVCAICNEHHHESVCPHQGEEWKPKWLVQNVTKYNVLHKDRLKKDFNNADPPLRFATNKSYQSQAKAATIEDKPEEEQKESSEDVKDNNQFFDPIDDPQPDPDETCFAGTTKASEVYFSPEEDSDGSTKY